jgi:hypothetical protein
MNKKVIVVLIAVVLVVVIVFLFARNRIIKNTGEVSVNVDASKKPASTGSGPTGQEQIDDPLHTIGPFDPQTPLAPARGSQMNPIKQNTEVLPYPQISNNYAPQQPDMNDKGKLDCFPKDNITPQELMPREDSYNTWQESSPAVSGHLADRNFLEGGYHFGIDTVSNTLKNPNLQLRSDPIIPQIQVGPWSQSTYSPDTNHRQFEIGGDY